MVEDTKITPAYYNNQGSNGTAVIDIVEHLNFCKGNAVKYLSRAGLKNPETEFEDIRKALWYLEREIERLEKDSLDGSFPESRVPIKCSNGGSVLDITDTLNYNRGSAVVLIVEAGTNGGRTEVRDLRRALGFIQRELSKSQSIEKNNAGS